MFFFLHPFAQQDFCFFFVHEKLFPLIEKPLFSPYLFQDFLFSSAAGELDNYGSWGRFSRWFWSQCARSIFRSLVWGNSSFSPSSFCTNVIINVKLLSDPSSMPWILIFSHRTLPQLFEPFPSSVKHFLFWFGHIINAFLTSSVNA